MFTGIIETTATVHSIDKAGSNVDIWIDSPITRELKVDQSVAHNGVCLTVVAINDSMYKVTAVDETLRKTNLSVWKTNSVINIERSLKIGDRLDGHFVQGHVDAIATCIDKKTLEGSWLFRFNFPGNFASLIIEKGSVCINGVSLTCFDVSDTEFSVTIIPFTYEHTNFSTLDKDQIVNVEFDVLGKYLLRAKSLS